MFSLDFADFWTYHLLGMGTGGLTTSSGSYCVKRSEHEPVVREKCGEPSALGARYVTDSTLPGFLEIASGGRPSFSPHLPVEPPVAPLFRTRHTPSPAARFRSDLGSTSCAFLP